MAVISAVACADKSGDAALKEKVESYAVVEMNSPLYDALTDNDKKIVDLFRQAGEIMDGLFWKQTFGDKAVIDAASSFASGQVYVALSRCRTLDGMVLASPLRQNSVMTDIRVEDYIVNQERAALESVSRLDSIKKEYFSQLLGDMFDFRNLAYQQKRMLDVCSDFPSGNPDTRKPKSPPTHIFP